ncbi:iron-sulfur cluster assembly protein [Sulfurifustis variabilis]|uniref:Iron-binding protein IscA n=1 Tax=Sulfurifustis variabilis TaxID=1675686 RepID=A0A1B4V9H4_9GAMM|nr:iron-sulfur cluster assembly protein IscA [Sulfurifustis variabilis]BAU48134.1 iron-sulfur cluster assembly protein [Sulfurifustis variabilis]
MAITLTEKAADRVRSFIDKRGKGAGLRLGVKNVGCSGKAYVVEYADSIEPGDQVFESHGVKVIISATNLVFLDGTEIDYEREGLSEGFKFRNPNEKARCGCGESFSI